MKKLCFIQTSVYPLFNKNCKEVFGGAEAQVYLLGKELSINENFRVSFLVGDYGQKKEELYNGIRVYRGVSPSENTFIKLFQALKLLWLLSRIRPDVVIVRTASAGTALAAFYARLFGKKFIYMAGSDIDVDGRDKDILGRINSSLYRWGMKRADFIIAQSDFQKEALKGKYKKDSIVIKSGYPIDSIAPEEKKYVLWVGRGEDIKRPNLFIDLAEKNSEHLFVLICLPHRDKAYYETVKKRAEKLKNVKFISHVPFDEIDQCFEKAKVLVNTSDFEGFPNTFIQAAKNKTPILSLNSNPDNFLYDYRCGFCAGGKFRVLNTYLNILVNDHKLYSLCAENAYRYAKQNHNIKKNAVKLEKVISGIVK